MEHALQCKKVGLVTICHNDVADEWGALCASAITLLAVAHKPLISYGGQQAVTGSTVAEPEEEDMYSRE